MPLIGVLDEIADFDCCASYDEPDEPGEPCCPDRPEGTLCEHWTNLGYTTEGPVWPPVAGTAKRAGELVERIDGQLAAWAIEKPIALGLVADNHWCVTALGRRGITVPGADT